MYIFLQRAIFHVSVFNNVDILIQYVSCDRSVKGYLLRRSLAVMASNLAQHGIVRSVGVLLLLRIIWQLPESNHAHHHTTQWCQVFKYSLGRYGGT